MRSCGILYCRVSVTLKFRSDMMFLCKEISPNKHDIKLPRASNYTKIQLLNRSRLVSSFSITHYLVPDNSLFYIQHEENLLANL